MPIRMPEAAVACGAAILLGCNDGQVLCAPSRGIAVAVDVRDSTSSQSLVGNARGVALVGSLSDSLRRDVVSDFPDTVLVGGAWRRGIRGASGSAGLRALEC